MQSYFLGGCRISASLTARQAIGKHGAWAVNAAAGANRCAELSAGGVDTIGDERRPFVAVKHITAQRYGRRTGRPALLAGRRLLFLHYVWPHRGHTATVG